MKHMQFYRSLFSEAFHLTWRYKGWWVVGFIIMLFSGSLGYQMVGQGLASLLKPEIWWSRWQTFSTQLHPVDLVAGQWRLLTTDPGSWVSVMFVFGVVLVAVLGLVALGVQALTLLVSAMKLREREGEFSLGRALRESVHHFWPAFAAVLILQILSQAVLLLFSVPVSALTLTEPGVLKMVATGIILLIYAIVSLFIAIVSIYTIIAIVVDDMHLGRGILQGWRLVRRAFSSSALMMLYQFLLLVGLSVILIVVTSLIVVPIAIIGFVLVANQQFDFTSFLPLGTFYLLVLFFMVFGAVNTVFQIISWCLMYFKLTERNESPDVLVAEIRW